MSGTDEASLNRVRGYLLPEPMLGTGGVLYGNDGEAGRRVVARDGTGLYVETYERDPKLPWVVLVHSIVYEFPADLTDDIDRLRAGFNVAVPTLRGHGLSEPGTAPVTLGLLADDLADVISVCAGGRAMVYCSCLSSAIGFLLAAERPDLVSRLVTYAGGAVTFSSDFAKVPYERHRQFDPSYFAFLESFMGGADAVAGMVDAYSRLVGSVKVGKDVFTRVAVPVLLLAPDRDPHYPLASTLEAYRYIRGAKLLVWPGDVWADPDSAAFMRESVGKFLAGKL